jgi:phosphoribosylformylglycinamidine synthase
MWALDNFCWTDPVETERNPEGSFKLAQLVRACMGLYDGCVAYRVPLISGKDSMRNDYRGGGVTISIPPTLLVSVVAIVEDATKAVTMDAKALGDYVYVTGLTFGDLGRSELAGLLGFDEGNVPRVRDLQAVARGYAALHQAMAETLVSSCHDCSDGGLGVALAETAFAGGLGMTVSLSEVPREDASSDAEILFSESPARHVVTVSPASAQRFEEVMGGRAARIGETTAEPRLEVNGLGGERVVDQSLEALKSAWQAPMRF